MIQSNNNGDESTYGNFDVTYWATANMVEFVSQKSGLGSSNTYEGFYYSPYDQLIGFQGNQVEFIEHQSGWIWNEVEGDNWEYIEKITEHWYWFEIHF